MNKKKFTTKTLIRVQAKVLLDFSENHQRGEDIVMYLYTLGKAWNDLNFIEWELGQLNTYNRPNFRDNYGEAHYGVYYGIQTQIYIKLISTLNELDIFLKHQKTISISEYIRKEYITNPFLASSNLSNTTISKIKTFLNKGVVVERVLAQKFAQIRSNIGFHYNYNFNMFSHIVTTAEAQEYLYYTAITGEGKIENTRMFYADLVDSNYVNDILRDIDISQILSRVRLPIGFVLEILNKKILGE